jgi:PAS domain S-box-containing protein
MNKPIRILLVDDSPHFLEAARDFLGYQESVAVVGTATKGGEALAQSQALQPDMILLDLNLGNGSGLILIPALKENLPDTKIIVLTMMEESSYRAAALEAGADGFVHKAVMSKTLTTAILDAMQSIRKHAAPANGNSETVKGGEARLMRLAEHLPDLVYRYEFKPKRGYIYVSPSATSMTGYTPQDHYDDPDLGFKLVLPQDRHILEEATRQRTGPAQPIVLRWVHKDGRIIWTEQRNVGIFDEQGELIAIEGIARNITERKQAEEALTAAEERFRTLIEYSSDEISILSASGELLYESPTVDPTLGYEYGEFQGRDMFQLVHPDDLERVQAQFAALLQDPSKPSRDQFRLKHRDGTWRWVEAVGTNLLAEPSVGGIVLNYHNITESKLAEVALRQSEERFRSYIQQANDFIFTLDPAGRITSANQAMCEALGYSEVELVGMSALELVTPGHQSEVAQTLQKIWNGTGIDGLEVPILTREGNTIIMHIRGQSMYKDERLLETLHIARDVTHQKQAEEQLKRRVAELEALYQSGIAFNHSFDQKEIGEKIIEVLSGRLNWHHASVRVRLGESREVELLAFSQPSDGQEGEERIRSTATRVGQGMAGWVIEHGQPLRLGDLDAKPRFISSYQGVKSGLYVPMQMFDRTVGCISVESEQPDAFTEEDERLLSTLAVQAAAALENARSYQAALFSARRLGVLYEAGQELVQVTQNLEELYTSVHFAVSQLMPTEAFTIALHNEEQGLLEGVYLFDNGGRWHAEPVAFGKGFSSQVISSGQTILIRDLLETSLEVIHYGTQEEIRSVLAVPLRNRGKVFGALSTQSYKPNAYTENDRYLLEMLAAQAAIALENARLFQNLQGELSERILAEERIHNQLSRLNALRTIDQTITSTFDMSVSLDMVLSQTLKLLSVDAAAVMLFTSFSNTLHYASWQGFHTRLAVDARIKLDQCYAGKAVLERRMVRIPNLTVTPFDKYHGDFVNSEGFASYHGMPLIVKGNVLGVLEVYDRSVTERDEEWLDFLATLAGQAALAIDNAQLFSSSQRELAERKRAQEELLKLNTELEERVASRTADLSRVNAELEHALRVKDEFLANMSHELRTPLNAIIGLTESLEEQTVGPLNERQGQYIGTIHESGQHLLELINDILDLARIESGNGSLNREYVDVRTVCQASLRMIKQMAQKRSQQVTFEVDERLERIFADERRLKQMLVNLLSNAVKFTPENGRVRLEARGKWEENSAIFSVRDTGIGIREEDLPRLFNPFVQLDSDLSRRNTGTGLGLALVVQMARMHGGSVGVESQPGTGSHFHFTLPLDSAEDTNTRIRRKSTGGLGTRPEKGGKKHTILLVEDTEEVVMVVRDFLEFAGFQVEVAKNGIDGIIQAKNIRPDLILMDVQMPDMDGLEATRRLRQEGEFKHTPIIAITALAMSGDRERCLAAGMDEYISKPVNLKYMVNLIHKFLPVDTSTSVM